MVAPRLKSDSFQLANGSAPAPNSNADSVKPHAAIDYPLGQWSPSGFQFHGPEARRQWNGDAFDQGVHQENWQMGRQLSPEETRLIAIGVPTRHDHYQGPDGAHYQMTPAAQEDPKVAALRTAYLAAEPAFERGQSALQHYAMASAKAKPESLALMAGGMAHHAITQPVAANENSPMAGPEEAAVSPQGQAILVGMKRAADQDARSGDDDDLRLAQADTGNASDAAPATAAEVPYDRWPDGDGQGREIWQAPYPEGGLSPAYNGEAKAVGPRAQEAEAAIRHLRPAKIWPIAGARELNKHKGGQGDGRYGMVREDGAKNHGGIDITAAEGTSVRAVNDGKIVWVVNNAQGDEKGAFGNEVIVQHADGTCSQYGHMQPSVDATGRPLKDSDGNDRPSLKVGATVRAGDRIGLVGKTGNAGGSESHLHFEVRYGDAGLSRAKRTTINPLYYLPGPDTPTTDRR
jgi:murein DD-endopeptidase MepM/ murein hydrolase activator NlpD